MFFIKMNKFLIVLVLIAIAAATGPDPKKWKVVNMRIAKDKKQIDNVSQKIVNALKLPKE
jgi:hypothetical protein